MSKPKSRVDESLCLHLMSKLRQTGALSSWQLLCQQDKTLKEYYDNLEHLKEKNYVQVVDGKLKLTDEGEKYLEKEVGTLIPFDFKCSHCEGKGYLATDKNFLEKYSKVLERRPLPSEKYDQTSITAEDAIIRVGFIHERGDLINKRLLMIGDFDCLSIVAAMTRLPKEVLVLDVDERLINYINDVAKELNLSHILRAETFDVRTGLKQEYHQAFDLFSCDPVETLEGITLYLSRGAQGLKGIGSSAYIGLTTLEASRKKWFDIEKVLLDMNFAITDVRRNFNGYPDTGLEEMHTIYSKLGSVPDCVWYWAAVFRVEAVAMPVPKVTGEYDRHGPDIYMDNEAWATPILDPSIAPKDQ